MPRHAKFDDVSTASPLYNRLIVIHACDTCDTACGDGGVAQLLELNRLSNKDTWIIDCKYQPVLQRDEMAVAHILDVLYDEGTD